MCVPVTRQKFHLPRYKEILDGCNNFRTYFVIGSLKDDNNSGHLDVQRCMILKAGIVVSSIYHNNNNIAVLSTFFAPYLRESRKQLLSPIEQLQ